MSVDEKIEKVVQEIRAKLKDANADGSVANVTGTVTWEPTDNGARFIVVIEMEV